MLAKRFSAVMTALVMTVSVLFPYDSAVNTAKKSISRDAEKNINACAELNHNSSAVIFSAEKLPLFLEASKKCGLLSGIFVHNIFFCDKKGVYVAITHTAFFTVCRIFDCIYRHAP